MISLRKSMDHLAAAEASQRAAADAFARAVQAAACYAVELLPREVAVLRNQLAGLAGDVRRADAPEQYGAAETVLEAQLRAYQESSHQELERMRVELRAAAEAMKIFADGIAGSGGEHAALLTAELKRMEEATRDAELEELRTTVRSGVQAVRTSHQELQRTHAQVVAQLKDEIRTLHRQLHGPPESGEESLGLWSRSKLDARIEDLLTGDAAFALVLVSVDGLAALYESHPRAAVHDALQTTVRQLTELIRGRAMTGEWCPGVFAVILEELPEQAGELARRVPRELGQPHRCRHHGRPHTFALQARAAVVGRPAGLAATRFFAALEQVAAQAGEVSLEVRR